MMNQSLDIRGLDRFGRFFTGRLNFRPGFGGTQVYRKKRALKRKRS